VILPLRH